MIINIFLIFNAASLKIINFTIDFLSSFRSFDNRITAFQLATLAANHGHRCQTSVDVGDSRFYERDDLIASLRIRVVSRKATDAATATDMNAQRCRKMSQLCRSPIGGAWANAALGSGNTISIKCFVYNRYDTQMFYTTDKDNRLLIVINWRGCSVGLRLRTIPGE